ncbi:MAG: hypothetical protein ACFFD2_20990 [Promethearchaeota archaeon]
MNNQIQVIGQKLDGIIAKIDLMVETITGLASTVEKTGNGLRDYVKKLAETIERYTDTMTERSKEDFELSRDVLDKISREIITLRRITGTDQIINITNALNQLLTLLQGAINPDLIQQQLYEITTFIKNYGGVK